MLLLSAMLTFGEQAVAANPLSEYLWQKRPLLLFATDVQDPRLQQTRHHLKQQRCELEDRDMVIGEFVVRGRSQLDGEPVSASDTAVLRDRYAIAADRFAVVLIGKDGGEKYRLYEVPDLNDIYALIDGMPMRQDEMRQNPVDCGQTT